MALPSLHDPDADECWTEIVNAMRQLPGTPDESASPSTSGTQSPPKNFVEQSMGAELTTEYVATNAWI
jgi:hypothetical protein